MDLFNNPMTQAAFNSLSDEDKEKYKKIGEEMYGSVNFTDSSIIDGSRTIPPEFEDVIQYIKVGLESGLHPSFLQDEEKKVLSEFCGENWYTKYGYVKEDLDSVVTLIPELNKDK